MSSGSANNPRRSLTESELYDFAVRALGRQMRTQAELERLMQSRAEPGERGEAAIVAVLARLREDGYLNDAAYAETYARLRRENEGLGERRVRQSLTRKGVAPEIVGQAVDSSYAHTSEEALARQYLERKHLGKPENERETARTVRRLLAAGFSSGAIYKILRQWDVPDRLLAALEDLTGETGEV
jgi:regulatory protein